MHFTSAAINSVDQMFGSGSVLIVKSSKKPYKIRCIIIVYSKSYQKYFPYLLMRWRAAIIALLLILPLSAGGNELEGLELGNLHSHTSYYYGTPEEAWARSYGLNSIDIIAHRGASGYLPEHTLEAYGAAYFMGSDYIEQDLVMPGDGVPICLHDLYLEPTTDVEEIFPERCRNDGRGYAADFTLEEIKMLKVHERTVNGKPGFPDRFPYGFPILRFQHLKRLYS